MRCIQCPVYWWRVCDTLKEVLAYSLMSTGRKDLLWDPVVHLDGMGLLLLVLFCWSITSWSVWETKMCVFGTVSKSPIQQSVGPVPLPQCHFMFALRIWHFCVDSFNVSSQVYFIIVYVNSQVFIFFHNVHPDSPDGNGGNRCFSPPLPFPLSLNALLILML